MKRFIRHIPSAHILLGDVPADKDIDYFAETHPDIMWVVMPKKKKNHPSV